MFADFESTSSTTATSAKKGLQATYVCRDITNTHHNSYHFGGSLAVDQGLLKLKKKLSVCRNKLNAKSRTLSRTKASIKDQTKGHIARAGKDLIKIRGALKNMKKFDSYQALKENASSSSQPHTKGIANALKHMTKSFRYDETHIALEQSVRESSGCAASKVSATINAVTSLVAETPFGVQCCHETTVLRHEQLKDMLCLILQSQVLSHAEGIDIRWDLSPQNSMELLACWVSFTIPNEMKPLEGDLAAHLQETSRHHQDGEFYRVIQYCLPVVRCTSKEGMVVGEKVKWIMELMGGIAEQVKFVTTDHGSENASAIRTAFGAENGITEIYCGVHALNLALTYGCATFDDNVKKSEKMTNKCLSHLDFVINLLRRYWDDIKCNMKEEMKGLPWIAAYFNKPDKSVRTRWLSAMLGLSWLLPKLHIIMSVLEKYMLKGRDGKIGKRWRQALLYLNNPAHMVKWRVLLALHEEFFGPALARLQSNHGYSAQHMSDWVQEWDLQLVELTQNIDHAEVEVRCENEMLFEQAIEAQTTISSNREIATEVVNSMVKGFCHAVRNKLHTDLGYWAKDASLEIASLLQFGAGRNKAKALIKKYGKKTPSGIPRAVWRDVVNLSKSGELYRDYAKTTAYLEKTFLGLCVHNVDPERTFNVVGAFLKTAPNAKEFCISAHTRNTFNHTVVSPAFIKKNRSTATSMNRLQRIRNNFAEETKAKNKRKREKLGITTKEEVAAALKLASEEGLEVIDLTHGDTFDGVVLQQPKCSVVKKVEDSPDALQNLENSVELTEILETSPDSTKNLEDYADLPENLEDSPDLPENLEDSPDLPENLEDSPDLTQQSEQSADTAAPLAPTDKCIGCQQLTENAISWLKLPNTNLEAFVLICDECEYDIDLPRFLKRKHSTNGNSLVTRQPGSVLAQAGVIDQQRRVCELQGDYTLQQELAEHCQAQMIHELMCGGQKQPMMPGCGVCKNKKRADELICTGGHLFCLECYIDFDNQDYGLTLTDYICKTGKPVCDACNQTTTSCRQCDGALLCSNCTQTWNQRIDCPAGYAVNITMPEFCESGGKPSVASRDNKFLKPGDFVAHVKHQAAKDGEKGGVYWDIGRIGTVQGGGEVVNCEDFEELGGGESGLERWQLTGDVWEAPVDELILITCREQDSIIMIRTEQIEATAQELEVQQQQQQQKRMRSAVHDVSFK